MRASRSRLIWVAGVAAVAVTAVVATAIATSGTNNFHGALEGYQETPLSISTSATGSFSARIVDGGAGIDYTLEYAGFDTTVTAAHIHFGQASTSGGVSAFLCSGGDKPACPGGSGTVTGTIDATDVVGPAGQGIAPGELDELVRAMRAGATYANVHSAARPSGELRMQLRVTGGR